MNDTRSVPLLMYFRKADGCHFPPYLVTASDIDAMNEIVGHARGVVAQEGHEAGKWACGLVALYIHGAREMARLALEREWPAGTTVDDMFEAFLVCKPDE